MPYLNGHAEKLSKHSKAILEALGAVPGLNIDEISALLRVRRTAANYHLRPLLIASFVVRVRQGRHQLHFLRGSSPTMRRAVTLLRVPTILAVALDVFHQPRDFCSARAARIETSERQVRRALRTLRKEGLCWCDPGERRAATVTHLHPDLRVLLARQPVFPWSSVMQQVAPRP